MEPNPVTGGEVSSKSKLNSKVVRAGALMAVAVIIGLSVYVFTGKGIKETVSPMVCSDVSEGSLGYKITAITHPDNGGQTQALESIAKEVLSTPGYDTDKNCLYFLTNYYLFSGDPKNAEAILPRLELVYKDPSELLSEFSYKISIEDIKGQIEYQKNFSKNILPDVIFQTATPEQEALIKDKPTAEDFR